MYVHRDTLIYAKFLTVDAKWIINNLIFKIDDLFLSVLINYHNKLCNSKIIYKIEVIYLFFYIFE